MLCCTCFCRVRGLCPRPPQKGMLPARVSEGYPGNVFFCVVLVVFFIVKGWFWCASVQVASPDCFPPEEGMRTPIGVQVEFRGQSTLCLINICDCKQN